MKTSLVHFLLYIISFSVIVLSFNNPFYHAWPSSAASTAISSQSFPWIKPVSEYQQQQRWKSWINEEEIEREEEEEFLPQSFQQLIDYLKEEGTSAYVDLIEGAIEKWQSGKHWAKEKLFHSSMNDHHRQDRQSEGHHKVTDLIHDAMTSFRHYMTGYEGGHYETGSKLFPGYTFTSSNDTHFIFVEIPGIPKEDIHLTLSSKDILTLHGEYEVCLPDQDVCFKRDVSKSFRMPGDVDPETVRASITQGVLVISLPRLPAIRELNIEDVNLLSNFTEKKSLTDKIKKRLGLMK